MVVVGQFGLLVIRRSLHEECLEGGFVVVQGLNLLLVDSDGPLQVL